MSIKETVDRLAGIVAKLPNPSEADGLIRVLRAETERLENMFALGHSLMHDYKVDLESLEEKTASAGEGFFIGALPVYGQAAHDFFVGLENGDGTIAFDHNSSDDINELVQHILSAPTEPVTAPAPAASPAVPEWIAVDSQKPKTGKKVLVFYKNSEGVARIVTGFYATKFGIEVPPHDDCDDTDYDEDQDRCYLHEGWYEAIDNWGDFSSITLHEGEPTHWMPLPALPAHDLSGSECGNCFEGKSDLDHECQKCGGTGAIEK